MDEPRRAVPPGAGLLGGPDLAARLERWVADARSADAAAARGRERWLRVQADDAVTHGVDQAAVRRGDGFVLDPNLVADSVAVTVASHSPDLHFIGQPEVEILGPTEVRVTITASIDYVFTLAVPGAPGAATVKVTATADARNDN